MVDDNRSRRPIRIGISACLLGRQVRFDGGHKRDAFLTETFGRFVEWVPVCPEVECGLGTPREAMRLLRAERGPRLVTIKTARDRLDAASKRELGQVINDYQRGLVPLIVPLTLVRHHVRIHDVRYLAGQLYLEPHPKELMLRNHV